MIIKLKEGRIHMINCIFVGIGGFIGSICRYLIGLLPINPDNGFPIKTLIINVVGAFAISIIAGLATKNKSISPQLILMLKVGICGGFTTFSTFVYEATDLLNQGHIGVAISYVIASVVLGIFAVFLGQMI